MDQRAYNGYARPLRADADPVAVAEEIDEQPAAVARALRGRLDNRAGLLHEVGLANGRVVDLERIVVLAAGAAYNAGLLGCHAFEQWAGVPARGELVTEWVDHAPVLDRRTLVIGVSRSTEDEEVFAALRRAEAAGGRTLALVDELDGGPPARRPALTGAPRTFTAQAALLALLALALGEARDLLSQAAAARLAARLDAIPEAIASFLARADVVDEIAENHRSDRFFIFLGRQTGLPVCLEGARKLTELARIPTEAYAAGEMKHGPIALIEEGTPVVCVATGGAVQEKIVSNIEEARARGARVIAVTGEGDEALEHAADEVVFVPRSDPVVQAIVSVVPLQVLASRLAGLRRADGPWLSVALGVAG